MNFFKVINRLNSLLVKQMIWRLEDIVFQTIKLLANNQNFS